MIGNIFLLTSAILICVLLVVILKNPFANQVISGVIRGDVLVTIDEFNVAIKDNGYNLPSEDVYKNFIGETKHFSKEEIAMFMAQLIHESGGFNFVRELACIKSNCADKYKDNVGLPGRYYFGRGYIQLTWGANYKAASQALGMGDYLLENPDFVASDLNTNMRVSVWYWNTRVVPLLKKYPNQFGYTTKAINGNECTSKNQKIINRAKNRWNIYLKVANAFGIKNLALENGCYHM